jgi:hypothetical protein
MKYILTFEEFLSESLNERYIDPVKEIHFETDPKKQEKLKLEFGKRAGGATNREKIEFADYALMKFRKSIQYGTGKSVDVFIPDSYGAMTSLLGNGPHTKKIKSRSWNQRSYNKWIKDMASGGGADHAFDMAQNANHEPGLIKWVQRNYPDDEPLDRIQWDIEAYT